MTEYPLLAGLASTHPGEILREDLPPAPGSTKVEIACRLGVSRQTLSDLIDETQPATVVSA